MSKININIVWIILLFSIIAFVYALPVFYEINNWGVQDWDQHFFYHAVPRTTILQYHQIPLWNPYYCSGTVLLANPQSRFLSPTFVLILLFGVVKGIKIEICLYLVIGMLGVYYLLRYYKLDKSSAIVSAFVFMLNSSYTLNLTAGMTWFLSVAYLPWIFVFYLKAFSNLKYALISSIFVALMYFGGGVYPLAITALFLIIFSVLSVCFKKYKIIKTCKVLSIIMICTLCLGAVKFFPSIEFIRQYPRKVEDYSGYSLNSLQYSLFNSDQKLRTMNKLPGEEKGFVNGFSYAMDENGVYIGIIPFILFLIGLGVYFRSKMPLFLCFFIFLWISFGNRISPSLWELIHKLPVYNFMRVAQRFRIVFIFCLTIFAGFGFQKVKDIVSKITRNKKLIRVFAGVSAIVILGDLIIVSFPIWKDAFTITPIKTIKSDKFYQVSKLPLYGAFSSMYPAFLCNLGTINAYETANVPRNALPIESKKYKGEVYLKNTKGEVYFKTWSPNKITISVDAEDKGYVVVNQNYYPGGWKVKGNKNQKVESVDGLLSVRVGPDENEVELYYFPISFVIGLIVTLITLLVNIIFMLK